jgi:hypothetical protein
VQRSKHEVHRQSEADFCQQSEDTQPPKPHKAQSQAAPSRCRIGPQKEIEEMSHYAEASRNGDVMRDGVVVNAADECNRLWSIIVRNEKRLASIRYHMTSATLRIDNLKNSFRKSGEDL